MYKPPFIRRILPWLYALVFLVVSPTLLLYTAGYRYNVKKHSVERDGTLIVDGTPKNADIYIDRVNSGQTTPYTFQNITPGWHTITVQKDGYSTWSKTLEVRSEEVTFANTVHLWRQTSETNVLQEHIVRIQADPKDMQLAIVTEKSSQEQAGTWSPNTSLKTVGLFSLASSTVATDPDKHLSLRWNSDGTSFVLNGINGSEPTHYLSVTPRLQADLLPNGIYHWSQPNTLLGSDDRAMTRLQTKTNRLSHEELPGGTLFHDGELSLQATGTPPVLFLTKESLQDRVYQLSSLNWRLLDQINDLLIFKQKDQSAWLALNPNNTPPYAGDVQGDEPRWFIEKDGQIKRGLLVQGGEIWMWVPGQTSTLLWRQTEPIKNVVWDPTGQAIIIADAQHLFALELDVRDGHAMTSLADFESIQDIAILKGKLYISGQKNGQDGLWERTLE